MRHEIVPPSRGPGPYGRGTTPYDPVFVPESRVYRASGFPERGVLVKARAAVHGDRQRDYGPPEVNHGHTARLWQAYLDSRSPGPLTAEDVCWLNILQKASREMHSKTEDGLVDAAGYVENIALVREANDVDQDERAT